MKTMLSILCVLLSTSLLSQNYPVTSITISLPVNPDANTANWKAGTSMLTISANARAVNGRPDVRVEDSKILLTIKKSGQKACGSYTNSSAPSANFNAINKIWSGNNAVSLLGQDCTLPPGEYELTVQFFGNGPRGLEPISEEKSKAFTLIDNRQQSYQPPQPLSPVNRNVIIEADVKKPITFRWTPVVPRPQDKVTYRLNVWQLMEGQTVVQAMKTNQPIHTKDIDNLTQVIVNSLISGPCKSPYSCEFVWNVQALNREGKPVGSNNGTSEAFTFSVASKEKNTRKLNLVSPENGAVVNGEPQFTWTDFYPNPDHPEDGKYKIKIVEITRDESPEQAIRTNKPFFEKDSANFFRGNKPHFEKDSPTLFTFQYPSSAPRLVDGKRYAWQVQALNRDGKPIGGNNGTSEVFIFKIVSKEGNTRKLRLVSPANGAELKEGPTFSWGGPFDVNGDGYYKIKIIEILNDESPEQAIRTNKPFFEKDSLPHLVKDGTTVFTFAYPPSAPKFVEGKTYAWQVQALNRDDKPVAGNNGTSEVWKFTAAPITSVKIDSIKLNCTNTYGIYNYTVYITNPLTMNVVLNGFWCRKPGDVNLTQLYTLNSQSPSLGTQITAGAQITVSGQVNLTSHVPNTMVRFSLRTHKINDPVDNATVTDSIKVQNCACDPCKNKTTELAKAGTIPTITFDNYGSVSVSANLTHTPNRVIKASAQIVNVERLGEVGCLKCTKDSKEFGNLTNGNLNNIAGSIANSNKGYGKLIQWNFSSPTLLNNSAYNLQMRFPPLAEISCCKDSIKYCIRWSFTDENCITCDTLICSVIVREYKKPTGPNGPISTGGAAYASQIKTMGSPYSDWYDQVTDELPKDFSNQLEALWQKEQRTKESEITREAFDENVTRIFFTIRGLKSKGGDADPIADILKNTTKANSPNTQCGNGDFETGQLNMNEWGGGYGTIQTNNNPSMGGGNYSSGFSPSPVGVNLSGSVSSNNHSIVSQGSLPNVISSLPSNSYAFRLGNSATGKGSEILSKRFTVDANGTGIIKFMYALVLQDPGSDHSPSAKPSFWVKIYDDSWNLITGKVYLDPLSSSPLEAMIADVSNPFFQVSGSVVYRDWTCAKIDLSGYKGKEVTVAFITTDCIAGAHYGYAAIDNWCGNCDGATTGSVNINTIADPCIKQGTKVCVNYTLPKIGTTTGSGTLKLQFYRNGIAFGTPLTQAVNSSSPNPFCFSIDPAKLPCDNGQDGYDMVVTGDFGITAGGITSTVTVTSPDPVGNPVEGIKPGSNNDLVCCAPTIPPTLFDICCKDLTKQVTTNVTLLGNTNVGYNTVRLKPTFTVGPKLIKKIRISVVNFESTSKNNECLSCESGTNRYGSMIVPQNIMGGGKDPIEGMSYPTTSNAVICSGCPPAWNKRLSSEVIWGSDTGAGYNLMDGSGDQGTTFDIVLPKKSTINCCDDTIRICIKYSFTDIDCRTCDTVICYKIINRTTIIQLGPSAMLQPGNKSINTTLKERNEKLVTVTASHINGNDAAGDNKKRNRITTDNRMDILASKVDLVYRK